MIFTGRHPWAATPAVREGAAQLPAKAVGNQTAVVTKVMHDMKLQFLLEKHISPNMLAKDREHHIVCSYVRVSPFTAEYYLVKKL
jgi:hypothetical protein